MADARLARPLWRGRTNVDAYTIAWIEHAEQIKRDQWPNRPELHHLFEVTQGGYQGTAGDPNSGTTHRLGGGTDMHWCVHPECLLALRLAGGFVWHRTPDQGPWPDHFHGAPLGHPYMDARLAAQGASYLAGGNGIGGTDDGPRLNPIPRPVWPWPQEEDMAQYAEQLDKIQAAAETAAKAAEQAVTRLDNQRERQRTQTARLRERLDKAIATGRATKAELEAMRADLDDEG